MLLKAAQTNHGDCPPLQFWPPMFCSQLAKFSPCRLTYPRTVCCALQSVMTHVWPEKNSIPPGTSNNMCPLVASKRLTALGAAHHLAELNRNTKHLNCCNHVGGGWGHLQIYLRLWRLLIFNLDCLQMYSTQVDIIFHVVRYPVIIFTLDMLVGESSSSRLDG